ncbi:MAG: MarR family transcriptional regulator [Rhizobacter sp.]|nr:MarR family transcriptional regulator [Rhizobacter sp.]
MTKPSKPPAMPLPARPSGDSLIELITLQWRRERKDLDLSNFLTGIYFMRLGTLVERAFDVMCQKRFGVSGSDMRVLLALRRGGRPYVKRPTDLFKALLVTSGAITKKVDRLAALDMVERLADPGYNGGFLVRLTSHGLAVVEEAVELLAKESVIGPAMDQFSAEDREAGSRFCLQVLAALENAAPVDDSEEDSEPAPVARRGRPPKKA